jgi:hypothetical protein
MKQSPELDRVQSRMGPGAVGLHGILGHDRRSLAEILEQDDNAVRVLSLTHEAIADRMEFFTQAGRPALGNPVTVDDRWEVRVDEWRGGMPCPWPHAGLHRKSNIVLTDLQTGEQMEWTDLTIHMIRAHGFYQGRGSRYRIDPERARRLLGL